MLLLRTYFMLPHQNTWKLAMLKENVGGTSPIKILMLELEVMVEKYFSKYVNRDEKEVGHALSNLRLYIYIWLLPSLLYFFGGVVETSFIQCEVDYKTLCSSNCQMTFSLAHMGGHPVDKVHLSITFNATSSVHMVFAHSMECRSSAFNVVTYVGGHPLNRV